MPEKGWYSLTVRKETAMRARELAMDKNLTVDELLNELMAPFSKGSWSKCTVCGARVKEGNTRALAWRIFSSHYRLGGLVNIEP